MDVIATPLVIEQTLSFIYSSRYALLFLGCFFEGTLTMAAGGVLWSLGSVSFFPMYLTLLAADIASDACWYFLGYTGTRRFLARWGHRIGVTPESLSWAQERFREHDTELLISSKLTMGFGLAVPTLITAGALRIRFWRFFLINTAGAIVWVLLIVLAGYYGGNALKQLAVPLRIGLAVIALSMLGAAVHYDSKHTARKSR